MLPIIPNIVKEIEKEFRYDVRSKGQFVIDLEAQLERHKKYNNLRADWAERRIKSIFREIERLGVKILSYDTNQYGARSLKATFQDVTMVGELRYEQMERVEAYKPWKRPKIVAQFWILDSKGNRCYLEGHVSSALKVVFGAHRMLTYNRLFAAVLDGMAR